MKSVREVEKISSSREQKLAELSGREKRALAAERRLATQLPSDTAVVRYTPTHHTHTHTHTPSHHTHTPHILDMCIPLSL